MDFNWVRLHFREEFIWSGRDFIGTKHHIAIWVKIHYLVPDLSP